MNEQEKNKLIENVLNGFDFVKVVCLKKLENDKTSLFIELGELHKKAEKLLRMALDHEDEEFWWAGGIGYGGFSAWWDKKRGLSLNYIITASKAKPIKQETDN